MITKIPSDSYVRTDYTKLLHQVLLAPHHHRQTIANQLLLKIVPEPPPPEEGFWEKMARELGGALLIAHVELSRAIGFEPKFHAFRNFISSWHEQELNTLLNTAANAARKSGCIEADKILLRYAGEPEKFVTPGLSTLETNIYRILNGIELSPKLAS